MSATLILLLPLLVLSVVLVLAFTGCSPFSGVPSPVIEYVQAVLASKPVAYWRLGEEPPPAQAIDSSGNNVNAQYHGGVVLNAVPGALVAKDPMDKAAEFNGTDAFVEVSPWNSSLNPPMDFSVELWIRPAAFTSGDAEVQQLLVSRDIDQAANLDHGYELSLIWAPAASAGIQARVGTGLPSPRNAEILDQIDPAKIGGAADWKYVVMTYVAGSQTLTLYRDGQQTATRSGIAYSRNTTKPLTIGVGTLNDPQRGFYKGSIDEVAIYNFALDAATIAKRLIQAGH